MKTIEGVAIVFNSLSEDLGNFKELIRPEAVDRTLHEPIDVRALVDHNSEKIIGRQGAGTLTLRKRRDGLHVEIWPPDTTVGRDIVELIAREDVFSMSFAFRTVLDNWFMSGETAIREVLDMRVFEVSPVVWAAYLATSVGVRAEPIAGERRDRRSPLERRPGSAPEDLGEAKRRALAFLKLCEGRGHTAGVSMSFDEQGDATIADLRGTPTEQRRALQVEVGHELREERARLAASAPTLADLKRRQDRVAQEIQRDRLRGAR